MKKKYIQPKTAKITFNYSEIVAASIEEGGGDVGWEDDEVSSFYADGTVKNDIAGEKWEGEE